MFADRCTQPSPDVLFCLFRGEALICDVEDDAPGLSEGQSGMASSWRGDLAGLPGGPVDRRWRGSVPRQNRQTTPSNV